jgi:hypothetical protein
MITSIEPSLVRWWRHKDVKVMLTDLSSKRLKLEILAMPIRYFQAKKKSQ